MNNNEDALTHGVTVMECEEKYRKTYFDYLIAQLNANRITVEHFTNLTEGY